MAKYAVCDLCGQRVEHWGDEIKPVTFLNGEHPHNGSEMAETVDVCRDCVVKIVRREPSFRIELADAKKYAKAK